MLSALRNFALTFLVAALIFGILAYVIVGFVIDTMSQTLPSGDNRPQDGYIDTDFSDTTEPSDTTDSEDTTLPPEEEIIGESFTMLLIGTNYQPEIFDDYDYEERWEGPGFPDKRNRKWGADMLIVLRVDKENRQFVFCPIPTNTRVLVDGSYIQLGDIISEKGVEFLCGKVSGLVGLKMDYYTLINVGSISDALDAIGEVTYYVPENMEHSDPELQLEISLKKGTTIIDGDRAEQLLRYNGYKNGELGRMNTHVEFIKAILAKYTNVTYYDKSVEFYDGVSEHVEITFTRDDFLNSRDLIFAYPKFEAVTLSYPGNNKVYDGVTYFEPSLSIALDMFDKYK